MLNSGFSLALVDESDRLPGYKELRASFVSPQAHFKKKLVPGLVVKLVVLAAQDAEAGG